MTSQQQLKRSLEAQKFRNASNMGLYLLQKANYMFSPGIELFWLQGLCRKKISSILDTRVLNIFGMFSSK